MSIEVKASLEWLKQVRRDLDACQKVIWLAGCRPQVPGGFDPAYVTDAQARLQEIDALIATAQQPASGGDERAAQVNDWFLSLPLGRQAVLRDDKWLLADAAFEAGKARAALPVCQPLRYTFDGELAECPCCGSLDVGGAHDTVNCYGCGLQITKPRPLKNAADAWNKRAALPVREAVAVGWKPAPVESTAEMEEAGCQAYMDADGTACVMHNSSMRHAYKAMLAAAPSPSREGVIVPPTLFDQTISWIEDRRRYGDEGTLHQVWHDLKTIQQSWRASAPSPSREGE